MHRQAEVLLVLGATGGIGPALAKRLVAEDVAAACGRLEGIVNCVGTILLKPAHMTSAAEWEATLASNLTSAFAVVRAGVRAMREHGGRIVLMSPRSARLGVANHETIAAAKAGLEGLRQTAAVTYAPAGIRVKGTLRSCRTLARRGR